MNRNHLRPTKPGQRSTVGTLTHVDPSESTTITPELAVHGPFWYEKSYSRTHLRCRMLAYRSSFFLSFYITVRNLFYKIPILYKTQKII